MRTARTTGVIITTGLMTIGRIRIKRRCRFSLALDLGRRGDGLEHDPEKWVPVFRKDHAQTKMIERDDDSKKSHPVLRRESLRQQHDGLRAGFAVLRDFQIFR